MKHYKQHCIFKAEKVYKNQKGWIVDLSPDDMVSPDHFWRFKTRKKARFFLEMVNGGIAPSEANRRVEG